MQFLKELAQGLAGVDVEIISTLKNVAEMPSDMLAKACADKSLIHPDWSILAQKYTGHRIPYSQLNIF